MNNPSPTALQVAGLSVSLGGREVVRDVSFVLAAGRWLSLVGPNGAGKSSLLRALAGISLAGEQASGQVRLAGAGLASLPPQQRALQRAWMGQQEPAPDDLSVRDVVMLARWPRQGWWAQPSAADAAAVNHALTQMDAAHLVDRSLGALSGGERQRVLLARAFATETPLLLLDEPLTHLDAPHQVRLLRLIRQRCAVGAAVVTVAHDLPWALQADELLVLADGRVLHHGPRLAADTHRAVETAFNDAIQLEVVRDLADPADQAINVRLNLG